MRVEKLLTKFGNESKDQKVIYTDEGASFISYDTVIATRDNEGNVVLDSYYWDYSATTGLYRNHFLGEGIAETRKKIENGIYKLDRLN